MFSAPVAWRRSARARRIVLRIDPRSATVVVTLPADTRREAGKRFLLSQADWVTARLAALPRAIAFSDGTAIRLHGRSCRIRHLPGLVGGPRLRARELQVGGVVESLADQVGLFLRGEAQRALGVLVAAKAALAQVRARRTVIGDPRTRWGSCAADGTLAFSWRLVMSPGYVQDYAAAHEVAHLRHMDHGAGFWGLVERLTPHREAATTWLSLQGPTLLRVGESPT